MEPVLKNGSYAIFVKTKEIKRFDIISFLHDDKNLIKNVIGLPDEKIIINSSGCFINGELVDDQINLQREHSWALQSKEYFVLGKNLNDSLDSRKLGPILHEVITHKYKFTIPFC